MKRIGTPWGEFEGLMKPVVTEHFGGGTIVYYIIAQPPQVLSLYSHLYTCVAYFLAIELGHMHLRY